MKEKDSSSCESINHEAVALACIRAYPSMEGSDSAKCLKVLKENFSQHNPNFYLKDKKGNEEPWTPLMYCCYSSFYEGVKFLLNKGADPNMPGKDGKTCLSISAIKDKPSIVSLLIERGAYVDQQDIQGKTALMNACEKGSFEVVKLLVDNKANIRLKSGEQKDALEIGRQGQRYHIVSYLEHLHLSSVLSCKGEKGINNKGDKSKTKI